MNIRPCRHPRCTRSDGDPALTGLGMCEPCQHHLHRLLGWLVLDWVNLSVNLPTPLPRGKSERRNTEQVYGHPAEWASDTATRIADVLNATHDGLADDLNETPPPHPGIADRIKVRAAWRYLESRIHLLAQQGWATDTATELGDLHHQIRSALGHNRPRQALPTPCPNCELRTVTRTIDAHLDQITREVCGWVIAGENYPLYTRMVLDAVLDADTPEPSESRATA